MACHSAMIHATHGIENIAGDSEQRTNDCNDHAK
jgi:hypothetical protein